MNSTVPTEQFTGQVSDWQRCVHPDDLPAAEESLGKLLSDRIPFDTKFRILPLNGTPEKWISAKASVILDNDNQIKRIIGINIDITAEKELENKQLDQLHNLDRFFNFTPDLLCIIGPNNTVIRANKAWEKLLGYDESRIIDRSLDWLIPTDFHRTWHQTLQLIRRNGGYDSEQHAIIPFRGLDDTIHSLEWQFKEVNDVIYAAARDVTQAQIIRDDLVRTRDLLNQTNQAAVVGGWEADLINNTLWWSDVTRQIHEVPKEFIPNVAEGINFYKEGVDRDLITQAVQLGIETGKPWDLELRLVTYTGKELWVRAVGEVKYNDDNEVIGLFGAFQDIDNRKRAQLALQIETRTT